MRIEWEDPPPTLKRRGAGKTERFVRALQRRPGKWAVYSRTSATFTIGHYRNRYPGTDWTSRVNPDGTHTIYGVWLGDVCSECGAIKVVRESAVQ